MVNYLASKIYTVRCRDDNSLIYVGSTTRRLSDRFSGHKQNSSCCSLKKYIEDNCNGDWTNWYIELHEEFSCKNKEELLKREGQVQREIATINKNIAGRTLKEWRLDNPERVAEWNKKYYDKHTNAILEQQKTYYANNADKIAEIRKEHYANNRAKIMEYKKQYYANNQEKFKNYYLNKKMNNFIEKDISVN